MTVTLSEDRLLTMLGRYFPVQHPSLLLGRGDDCCVLRAGNPLCVSADLFLEDVHFRRSYFLAREVGHKALAVNVSDLAACGARPVAFTLCLGLPASIPLPWVEEFFAGMADLAHQQRMVLAGGDLACADKIHISITVWGESTGTGAYLTRGGAMPGDSLFVIGALGLARTGLQLLESQGRSAMDAWPMACAAHLNPQPQVEAGLTLARIAGTSRLPVLMDVSDGLARDLPHLLGITGRIPEEGQRVEGAGMGAELIVPEGLLHPEVISHARNQGLSPVLQAYEGGEDYALLGACAPELLPALHAALPRLQGIGTVTDSGNILCNNTPVRVQTGFDHFQKEFFSTDSRG
ncbi:MAG: thiamine-phosphate kinase [Desulfovibrionaceae bacterium]